MVGMKGIGGKFEDVIWQLVFIDYLIGFGQQVIVVFFEDGYFVNNFEYLFYFFIFEGVFYLMEYYGYSFFVILKISLFFKIVKIM